MNYSTAFIIGLIIFLNSCSSDPCEELQCVNGSCVDGTCQCDEGFVGPLCDQLPCVNGVSENGSCDCEDGFYGKLCDIKDIEGYYFITSFLMEDCPNYLKEYDLDADASVGKVCGPNHNDIEICFSNGLSLNDDGTASWIRSTTLDNGDGTVDTRFLEFEKGTYRAFNENVVVSLNNGDVRSLTIDKRGLTWVRGIEDGGTNCVWTEEYTRR